MVKQFMLLIQLVGLFFYQLILTGDISVSQKVPETIQVGTESFVEITINKSDVTGFAKVQQDIPEGFTVEAIETKGATFSYKDNRVKFIWMSLPVEEQFSIKYKIKPNEGVSGEFSLEGKFSFIADSERKNIEIPAAKFSVSDELLSVNTTEEEPVVEDPVLEEPVVEEPEVVDPVVEDPVVVVENETQEKVTVSAERTIEDEGDGNYKVTVKVNKQGVEGFAKFSDEIPAGFVAKEGESAGGIFSFKDGVAKVLWMAVPKSEDILVSYQLVAETAPNQDYDIKGAFAYLENDVTAKQTIDVSTLTLNIKAVEVEHLALVPDPVVEDPVVEDPVVEEPVVEDPIIEEPEVTTPVVNTVSTIPSPENGVSYKVQVAAGHKKVANNYFAVTFNLKDNVSTENHEGWIKYLVGSYPSYKEARDKRNVVRNNVKRAFVTAYNSGTRITVQEALMISNQKWFK